MNVDYSTQRVNVLCGQILKNQVPQNSNIKDTRTIMLVWDTGALYSLTPFRGDFIYYVKCDLLVKDVTKVNRVVVIRTTIHKFINRNGQDILLTCISYHLTQTYVLLFSSHTYH